MEGEDGHVSVGHTCQPKLSVAVGDQPKKMIPKEKKDNTPEDISIISKHAKVRHLLHSALDCHV